MLLDVSLGELAESVGEFTAVGKLAAEQNTRWKTRPREAPLVVQQRQQPNRTLRDYGTARDQ